jgi:hypothetical protein
MRRHVLCRQHTLRLGLYLVSSIIRQEAMAINCCRRDCEITQYPRRSQAFLCSLSPKLQLMSTDLSNIVVTGTAAIWIATPSYEGMEKVYFSLSLRPENQISAVC